MKYLFILIQESLMKNKNSKSFVKRTRLDILRDTLKVSRGGARKTEIIYKVNTNSSQVQEYLQFLEDVGLLNVKENNGKVVYETSERGEEFIEEYEKLDNLFNNKQ